MSVINKFSFFLCRIASYAKLQVCVCGGGGGGGVGSCPGQFILPPPTWVSK